MDIGLKENTLLIFGGPYSNLQAVQALQKVAQQLAISPENIICTGDIVAYCAQPSETTDAIKEWGIHVLMGNCEESFANESGDCGCGFEEGTSCDLLSNEWFTYANQQLRPNQRQWFLSLPRTITFQLGKKICQVVHGSVTQINQFLFDSSPTKDFEHQYQHTDADIVIAGHSGIPFTRSVASKIWHNAGAIGIPANDGTHRTWFSLLRLEAQEKITIQHCALNYDYQQANKIMVSSGLDNGYAKSLISGLWPSLDVLPEMEKNLTGIALTEHVIILE